MVINKKVLFQASIFFWFQLAQSSNTIFSENNSNFGFFHSKSHKLKIELQNPETETHINHTIHSSISWKNVIDECNVINELKNISNYLKNFVEEGISISDTNNYNPFNGILNIFEKSTNYIDRSDDMQNIIRYMVMLGANINQEEKNYNIIRLEKKHTCSSNCVPEIKHVSVQSEDIEFYKSLTKPGELIYTHNIPTFNAVNMKNINSKDKMNLLKIFIENKADVNAKNILIRNDGLPHVIAEDSILEAAYYGFRSESPEIIKFLFEKGLDFFYQRPKKITINGIEFEPFHTDMLNNFNYCGSLDFQCFLNEDIIKNQSIQPLWIDSSAKNQITWIENIKKIKVFPPKEVQQFIEGACSEYWKKEKIDSIKKAFNVLFISTCHQIINDHCKKETEFRNENNKSDFFKISKYIRQLIAEFNIAAEAEELESMIQGATTVKIYGFDDGQISLYEACERADKEARKRQHNEKYYERILFKHFMRYKNSTRVLFNYKAHPETK